MAKQQNRLYPLRAERTLPPDTSQLKLPRHCFASSYNAQ